MKKKCSLTKKCAIFAGGVAVGLCVGIHRKAIKALIKHEPLPKAPSWHFWVKNREN